MKLAIKSPLTKRLEREMGRSINVPTQMGMLGGGNHFLEIVHDEDKVGLDAASLGKQKHWEYHGQVL